MPVATRSQDSSGRSADPPTAAQASSSTEERGARSKKRVRDESPDSPKSTSTQTSRSTATLSPQSSTCKRGRQSQDSSVLSDSSLSAEDWEAINSHFTQPTTQCRNKSSSATNTADRSSKTRQKTLNNATTTAASRPSRRKTSPAAHTPDTPSADSTVLSHLSGVSGHSSTSAADNTPRNTVTITTTHSTHTLDRATAAPSARDRSATVRTESPPHSSADNTATGDNASATTATTATTATDNASATTATTATDNASATTATTVTDNATATTQPSSSSSSSSSSSARTNATARAHSGPNAPMPSTVLNARQFGNTTYLCPFCPTEYVLTATSWTQHVKTKHGDQLCRIAHPSSGIITRACVCLFPGCKKVSLSPQGIANHWTKAHKGIGSLRAQLLRNLDEAQMETILNSAPVVDRGSALSVEEIAAIPWPVSPATGAELDNVRNQPVPVSDALRAHITAGQPHAQQGVGAGNVLPVAEAPIVDAVPQGFALDREQLHELRSIFCAGIFRVHYKYETRMREIAHRLMRRIIDSAGDADDCVRHSTAFLVLPALFKLLTAVKAGSQFLATCEVETADLTTTILQRAVKLSADVLRRRVTPQYGPQPAVSQAVYRRKAKRLVERMMRDGRLGAATAQVTATENLLDVAQVQLPPIADRETIENELRRLNPARSAAKDDLPPLTPANLAAARDLPINGERVMQCMRLLPKWSANGPSGWTNGLILQIFHIDHASPQIFETIAQMFLIMASNAMPSEGWITSRALLINKTGGGYRPLGIGESWYRFLTRCLLSIAGPVVGCKLAPLQFGCGISGGCEIAGKLAGFMYSLSPEHVLIKTDLANAFNTVARRNVFQGLAEFYPALLPWFTWAYGAPSPLVNHRGERIGLSQTGVRQGDPLAALLFCVAIHPAVVEMNEMLKAHQLDAVEMVATVWLAAYMDDITLALPAAIAPAVCRRIVEICQRHNLPLNLAKCRVIGEAMPRYLEGHPNEAPLPFPLRPAGDTVLGNPVGTANFCQQHCSEFARNAAATLRAIDALQLSCRTGVQMIRFCVNTRVQYMVRTHETVNLDEILSSFDNSVDGALWRLANHDPGRPGHPAHRAEVSSLLRSLPLHLGGLGIMRHSWVAGHFGKASSRLLAVQFLDMYTSREEQEPWMLAFRNSLAAQDLARGCPLDLVLNPDHTATIATMETKVADALTADSSQLTSTNLRSMRNQLLAYTALSLSSYIKTNFSVAQAAWFVSSQFEGSGRWLGAPCCALQHPALVLSDREFHAALRMRLLLQNAVSNDSMPLPTHSRSLLPFNPAEPLHMLDERAYNHKEYHARHNACRDVLARVLQSLPNVQKGDVDKEHELPGQEDTPEERRTRADVFVLCRAAPNVVARQFVFDIAVTNPAALTYRAQYPLHPDNPEGSFYGAALARQAQKQARYARFQLGDSFIPFAIDATGRLGPEARRFMERAFKIDDRTTPNYKNKALYLQARLGAACMKVNAQIVIRSAHALAQRGRVGGIAVD